MDESTPESARMRRRTMELRQTSLLQLPLPSRIHSIGWKNVERAEPPGGLRSVTIDQRVYPFNPIDILEPAGVFIVIRVLTAWFSLADICKLLHLRQDEIEDMKRLRLPKLRQRLYAIEETDITLAKRVLMAHVKEGSFLRRCLKRVAKVSRKRLSRQDSARQKRGGGKK